MLVVSIGERKSGRCNIGNDIRNGTEKTCGDLFDCRSGGGRVGGRSSGCLGIGVGFFVAKRKRGPYNSIAGEYPNKRGDGDQKVNDEKGSVEHQSDLLPIAGQLYFDLFGLELLACVAQVVSNLFDVVLEVVQVGYLGEYGLLS